MNDTINGCSSPESERAVLGLLLSHSSLIPAITDVLVEDDLYAFSDRKIFAAVRDLHRERPAGLQTVDIAAVYNRLLPFIENGDVQRAYLAELLCNQPVKENWEYHTATVKEASARRKAAILFRDLADKAERPVGPLAELLEEADAGCKLLRSGSSKRRFPAPVAVSQLRAVGPELRWIWANYLLRGHVTLLSAYWKAGKTTLLSHLALEMVSGGLLCDQQVIAGKILVVTEESEAIWAERRDKLGLQDNLSILARPFTRKPDLATWISFIDHLAVLLEAEPVDLVVFDSLAHLWPVKDENDAAQVQEALMPLHRLTALAALMLFHHLSKADGKQATGSRGSGALTSWVDAIIELRRYSPEDTSDRRRVIQAYGRWDGIPAEVVIELEQDGSGYRTSGDRYEVERLRIRNCLLGLLPNDPPGWSIDKIQKEWKDAPAPGRNNLLAALRSGAELKDWQREGIGKKGSKFRAYPKTLTCTQ